MPERAAEARLALDDTREELIAKAVALWTPVHSTAGNRAAADGAADGDVRPATATQGKRRAMTFPASLPRTTGASPSRT